VLFRSVEYYGDKVLRPKTDIPVSAFSFTEEGIKKALAEQKKIQAASK